MSRADFEFEFRSFENLAESLIENEDEEEDNGRLVDELGVAYKNGNSMCKNQEQEEEISTARENMEDSTKASGFDSETQHEKEKEKGKMSNRRVKMALISILIFGFLLLGFVLVVMNMSRKSESEFSSSSSTTETTGKNEDGSEPIDPQPLKNCRDAMEILPSPRSKKQRIYPHGNGTSLEVLCDFEADGGGWTIIQKRSSGPRGDFNRTWAEYSNGFGSLEGNFWLGLDNIHALTQNRDQELRIELEDFEGEKRWVKYSNFSISDASDFYRLAINGFSGGSNPSAGDSMTRSGAGNHNGMRFSTWDKDNDNAAWGSCADAFPGGWWYDKCFYANLNGVYREKGEIYPVEKGIHWSSWRGFSYSLAKTEMKIRTRK